MSFGRFSSVAIFLSFFFVLAISHVFLFVYVLSPSRVDLAFRGFSALFSFFFSSLFLCLCLVFFVFLLLFRGGTKGKGMGRRERKKKEKRKGKKKKKKEVTTTATRTTPMGKKTCSAHVLASKDIGRHSNDIVFIIIIFSATSCLCRRISSAKVTEGSREGQVVSFARLGCCWEGQPNRQVYMGVFCFVFCFICLCFCLHFYVFILLLIC